MNRLVSTRSVLALRPLLVAPRRNITYAHTSYQTTTLDEHGLPQTETVEIFATSETNKVGIVTQKEYYDEGMCCLNISCNLFALLYNYLFSNRLLQRATTTRRQFPQRNGTRTLHQQVRKL